MLDPSADPGIGQAGNDKNIQAGTGMSIGDGLIGRRNGGIVNTDLGPITPHGRIPAVVLNIVTGGDLFRQLYKLPIGPTIRYRITDKAPLITKVPFDRLYSFLLSYKLGISSNIKQEIADRLLHLFEFDDCIIRLQGRDNIIDQKIIDNLMNLMLDTNLF